MGGVFGEDVGNAGVVLFALVIFVEVFVEVCF